MTHVSIFAISAGLALSLAAAGSHAQEPPKVEEKKEIIIKERGGDKEKMTIVIDGDKVTVNGKPLSEFEGDNIVIRKHRSGDAAPFVFVGPGGHERTMIHVAPEIIGVPAPGAQSWSFVNEDGITWESNAKPRALLGVITEKDAQGAKILEISDGSAAEKAGLKAGDIITAVGGKSVTGPETLMELVRARKPEELVEVSYLRDKKKKSTKVILGKSSVPMVKSFDINVPEIEAEIRRGMKSIEPELRKSHMEMQRLHRELEPELRMKQGELERMQRELQREFRDQHFDFSWEPKGDFGGGPKMGMRVEDREDGAGVSIVEVEAGSAAEKAGLKKGDVLTYIDGKKIQSTDEARSSIREGREKSSLPVTVSRDGKPFNVEVKFPKNLKKADL